MEVIRRGVPPGELTAQWTCVCCDSVIKSKISEGQRVSDQREGDYIANKCPVCGCINNITVKKYGRAE